MEKIKDNEARQSSIIIINLHSEFIDFCSTVEQRWILRWWWKRKTFECCAVVFYLNNQIVCFPYPNMYELSLLMREEARFGKWNISLRRLKLNEWETDYSNDFSFVCFSFIFRWVFKWANENLIHLHVVEILLLDRFVSRFLQNLIFLTK